MKNIVITGGAGFIGSHVVRLFVNKYPEYHPVSAPGNHEDLNLITYVKDRLDHDAQYAIDSTKLQKELDREPSLQFEEGIEKTVRWHLDNEKWLENVTSVDYQKYYEKMYLS